jgi:hypothetical protein
MEALDTPLLFLVFNRPDTTRLVFEKIREIQPRKLFVAADGPRADKEVEKEKCIMVRSIATAVDWDCELKILFRNENLGCGKAVSEGITWFFEHVEEGIILEDDCLPSVSFFIFCQKMLRQFRDNDKIMHIGGSNFQNGIKRGFGDIYFSKIPHVWGWATWRESWNNYKFSMKNYSYEDVKRIVKLNVKKNELFDYWVSVYYQMIDNPIDTWDYQWHFAIWRNNGIAIIPQKNLISNIGFGSSASHTFDVNSFASNIEKHEFQIKTTPIFVKIHDEADIFTYKNIYYINFKKNLIEKMYLRNKFKKIYTIFK